ncbi:MAG: hypothetical protein K0S08_565 [Gammaproteobacteria bacterium]|jgi:hypothetical protein|nr:hypothetical protein [Gammaproteobacteria bacterium]
MSYPDIIGLLGVLIIIVAYFYLQVGRMQAEQIAYSFLNALGAAMIIFSLIFKWNLSSFVMEGTWFLLSCYGLVKAWLRPKK